ncbi:DUF4292 domain-containing protein [Desulfobacca acetoxidans]|uniref:DUF4292 domain-containing protein n=1 Tax=Desulfobacca acetoxidans (strain ATCC 700848 / DSM 11109 / ASRB2) TaxID=880072 RepID=F2NEJ6_DESAR|nr:DUF4292 domain-containing protein [Desulfobacca acetoxidans]AEB08186.1 hypothetical protein Desac_0295 [Desulfobacca acetoxidans DSM 11109]
MNFQTRLYPGLALGLILICLSACARLPIAPPGERPVVSSASDLMHQLEAKANAVQSLQAKGRVSVISPQKNYNGNALFAVFKPSLLRVDVLNFWGQPAVAFISTEQEIKFMVYPESKLYRGPATSANLSRFIPLPISLHDFMAILTGRVAFERYDKPTLAIIGQSEAYFLELSSRDERGRLQLTIEAQELNITSARWLDLQGREFMQAQFSDFITRGGISGPQQIQLASGDGLRQMRLRYRELTYNVPFSDETLILPVSGDIQELPFPQ